MELRINYDKNVITHDNNALKVKLKTDASQHASVHLDGLYVESKTTGTGSVYPDGYRSPNGLAVGITSPDDGSPCSRRVVAPSITHRIFTCTQADGSDINLRGGLDIIYPGDMYRVIVDSDYHYYLIIQTNGSTILTRTPNPVAVIPITATDTN
jgi:hypothetical protein